MVRVRGTWNGHSEIVDKPRRSKGGGRTRLLGFRLRSTGGGSRSGFEGEGSSVFPLDTKGTGKLVGLMGMYPSKVASELLMGGEAMGTYESSHINEWFSVTALFINMGRFRLSRLFQFLPGWSNSLLKWSTPDSDVLRGRRTGCT